MEALKLAKYTFEEWLEISVHDATGDRSELIDGHIYGMASANTSHQRISGELFNQLYNFLKGKRCEVFTNLAVRLDAAKDTAFIPDITVVCDRDKLKKFGCEGVPDLIVEILSPSNSQHDKVFKYNEYRKAGVREYWVVDPSDNTAIVHTLLDDKLLDDKHTTAKYTTAAYDNQEVIPVHVLPGCEIDLSAVFDHFEQSDYPNHPDRSDHPDQA